MAKIFVEPSQVLENKIIIEDREDLHHLQKVLRVKTGEGIEISDGTKWEYICEISKIEKEYIEATILDKQSFAREPHVEVTLFQAIPKAQKMESIIQKCVELGISEIVPMFTERTVVTEKGNFAKKQERWQKIADGAASQSKRGKTPQIKKEIHIKDLFNSIVNYEIVIFPYENEENFSIKDCLRGLSEKPKSLAIVIGSEGGFSETEARKICEAGGISVTLGKTILRTETAGPTALAMVMYELEL